MTRFARSKGSKSSNERIPEQATPWRVMREQLQEQQKTKEDSGKREEFEAKRKENYENFLKDEITKKTVQTWCDFPNDSTGVQKESSSSENVLANSKNKKKDKKKKEKTEVLETVDSEKSLDVDDPELSKWCDEYSDPESNERLKQLTTQLEEICQNELKNKSTKAKQDADNNVDESIEKCRNKKPKKGKNNDKQSPVNTSNDWNVEVVTDKKRHHKRKSTTENEHSQTVLPTEEIKIVQNIKKSKKKQNNSKEFDAKEFNEPSHSTHNKNALNTNNEDSIPPISKSSKKKKRMNSDIISEEIVKPKKNKPNNSEVTENIGSSPPAKSSKKNKKKIASLMSTENNEGMNKKEIPENIISEEIVKPKKNKPNNSEVTENVGNTTQAKLSKKKKKKIASLMSTENNEGMNKKEIPENNSRNKKKDNKEHARRKPMPDGKNLLIVNGEELEVVTLHGFPITSKDATRIQELRKNLISKGIPKSEVERTIKLERRRAEKTLARLKKNLCFHCRKGGHILSECPDLNKDGNKSAMPSSGLCFKCGSTEHTHFQCRVVRTQDYKFAQCFICKEQGHISRQCPDNPKGIYPKGGACRVCGDVTHLKKDCPQIMQQREDDTIRLETLQSENLEDIGGQAAPKVAPTTPAIKRVKF